MAEPRLCEACGHIDIGGAEDQARRAGLIWKSKAEKLLGVSEYELGQMINRRELAADDHQGRECVTLRSLVGYIDRNGVPDDDDRLLDQFHRTGQGGPRAMMLLDRAIAQQRAADAAQGIYPADRPAPERPADAQADPLAAFIQRHIGERG